MNRVVITGVGTINSLGENLKKTFDKINKNENGITKLQQKNILNIGVAGQISNDLIKSKLTRKELIRTDRVTQLSLIAAKEALDDSLIKVEDNNNVAVIVGNGFGGINSILENASNLSLDNPISPFTIINSLSNLIAANISLKFNLKGTSMSVNTACASGTDAIGIAFENIRNGNSKISLAGGSEASVNDLIISGFDKIGALSHADDPDDAIKPFDIKRDGFVIAEGSAFLVLESLDHARKRNAHIYAEIKGYNSNNDAYNLLAPEPNGDQIYKLISELLKNSNVKRNEIDYINAHGTSTLKNDEVEAKTIEKIFGKNNKMIVSSTKSFLGHTLGASGAIEAAITAKSIDTEMVAGVKNLNTTTSALNFLPNKSKKMNINNAISESFGFGGHNSALLFSKY